VAADEISLQLLRIGEFLKQLSLLFLPDEFHLIQLDLLTGNEVNNLRLLKRSAPRRIAVTGFRVVRLGYGLFLLVQYLVVRILLACHASPVSCSGRVVLQLSVDDAEPWFDYL